MRSMSPRRRTNDFDYPVTTGKRRKKRKRKKAQHPRSTEQPHNIHYQLSLHRLSSFHHSTIFSLTATTNFSSV
ncbi:hypothetical protein ACRALDRAFT_205423 [Sodiomyces alcalophilus JCM 7366]|uniref:uncharacterized protein n=1 Tax=Sodiomyces alcalophilus JCM 7366 TaxID=591952 RepID=UPI0039B6B1AB